MNRLVAMAMDTPILSTNGRNFYLGLRLLWRWWQAWELGYWPIREDGDKLVVGALVPEGLL